MKYNKMEKKIKEIKKNRKNLVKKNETNAFIFNFSFSIYVHNY